MVVVHESFGPSWTVCREIGPSTRASVHKINHASTKEGMLLGAFLFLPEKSTKPFKKPLENRPSLLLVFFFWWGTLQKNQINTKIGSNKPQIKHIKRGWIILLNPSKNLQGWPSNCPIFAPELPRSDPKLSCIHHHIVLQQYLPPNSKAGRVTWNPPPGRRKTW